MSAVVGAVRPPRKAKTSSSHTSKMSSQTARPTRDSCDPGSTTLGIAGLSLVVSRTTRTVSSALLRRSFDTTTTSFGSSRPIETCSTCPRRGGQVTRQPKRDDVGERSPCARPSWRRARQPCACSLLLLDLSNLAKVTTFLRDRAYADANTAVRTEVLGDHRPALTVVITGIFDEARLLEIEAVAAA